MGSVCCTAGRTGDMAESSHVWSMEQTGHGTHGLALSPPPFSSRWDMKAHFMETATDHGCMPIHRTPFSSSRSFRSSSNTINNSKSSSLDGVPFHRRCETTTDGLLALFSSPSESFHYSQQSVDQIPGSFIMSTEPFLRSSEAGLRQEESSGRLSKSSSSKFDMSRSHTHALSWQGLDSTTRFTSRDDKGMASSTLGPHSYHPQKLKSSHDPLPREQLVGNWKMRGFSEFMDSSRSGTSSASRLSGIGLSSDSYGGLETGKPNICIGSSKAMLHQGIRDAEAEEDTQKCGLCFKAISERSPWCFSRVLGSRKELPVVGVLDCGHVYHAECLDQVTPAMQAHDPPCPACDSQKKSLLKGKTMRGYGSSSGKAKISRVGISDEDPNDGEWSKIFQPSCTSWPSQKVGLQLPTQSVDRKVCAKSLVLWKQCSVGGKARGDSINGSFAKTRPGYPWRVSPESNQMDDGLVLKRL